MFDLASRRANRPIDVQEAARLSAKKRQESPPRPKSWAPRGLPDTTASASDFAAADSTIQTAAEAERLWSQGKRLQAIELYDQVTPQDIRAYALRDSALRLTYISGLTDPYRILEQLESVLYHLAEYRELSKSSAVGVKYLELYDHALRAIRKILQPTETAVRAGAPVPTLKPDVVKMLVTLLMDREVISSTARRQSLYDVLLLTKQAHEVWIHLQVHLDAFAYDIPWLRYLATIIDDLARRWLEYCSAEEYPAKSLYFHHDPGLESSLSIHHAIVLGLYERCTGTRETLDDLEAAIRAFHQTLDRFELDMDPESYSRAIRQEWVAQAAMFDAMLITRQLGTATGALAVLDANKTQARDLFNMLRTTCTVQSNKDFTSYYEQLASSRLSFSFHTLFAVVRFFGLDWLDVKTQDLHQLPANQSEPASQTGFPYFPYHKVTDSDLVFWWIPLSHRTEHAIQDIQKSERLREWIRRGELHKCDRSILADPWDLERAVRVLGWHLLDGLDDSKLSDRSLLSELFPSLALRPKPIDSQLSTVPTERDLRPTLADIEAFFLLLMLQCQLKCIRDGGATSKAGIMYLASIGFWRPTALQIRFWRSCLIKYGNTARLRSSMSFESDCLPTAEIVQALYEIRNTRPPVHIPKAADRIFGSKNSRGQAPPVTPTVVHPQLDYCLGVVFAELALRYRLDRYDEARFYLHRYVDNSPNAQASAPPIPAATGPGADIVIDRNWLPRVDATSIGHARTTLDELQLQKQQRPFHVVMPEHAADDFETSSVIETDNIPPARSLKYDREDIRTKSPERSPVHDTLGLQSKGISPPRLSPFVTGTRPTPGKSGFSKVNSNSKKLIQSPYKGLASAPVIAFKPMTPNPRDVDDLALDVAPMTLDNSHILKSPSYRRHMIHPRTPDGMLRPDTSFAISPIKKTLDFSASLSSNQSQSSVEAVPLSNSPAAAPRGSRVDDVRGTGQRQLRFEPIAVSKEDSRSDKDGDDSDDDGVLDDYDKLSDQESDDSEIGRGINQGVSRRQRLLQKIGIR
ncbi:uncharacterized protein BJ171DRAFT_507950 [Polychytrium aggregatum]|uniref:uncharacterized protein n=1 Tax=Polychytrium aggregatum TaxID=110093 RepID=UPI0022FEEC1D|nr:uncharacterized protein BJ171DRAFT_507950 [Polychytrium aggregatum]KAI9203788.1 hypothetical protein BJ171DRAFT_507950 [Polychytrium aggregatum]